MTKNMGSVDRALRLIVGVALIAGAFLTDVLNPWGFIGIVPIATALIGWCPAYLPFGIKTCKTS
ncbi:DUF2892 domain-containing protein [Roseospira marina]|uniref:DUF2892 domain-containing protein n=1 Tax=Roseospira marina TaxID=140057 RepID=A0A5M6IAL9_9PROT|nr:DUF2892 domain-containing protein [Roseospira marina]KAA5604775.1 DUF2892 domain-containing protein [Roseospira marina]MBB4313457.1 hypothetical protein [Roseospira marina]MBB5086619.1 hypothetical protein [Roseospira marina]